MCEWPHHTPMMFEVREAIGMSSKPCRSLKRKHDSMDDEEDIPVSAVQDLLAPELVHTLPAVAPAFTAHKYIRLFALDVGAPGNDQYVYLVPNGLCVVGLAPSHTFIKACKGTTMPEGPTHSMQQQSAAGNKQPAHQGQTPVAQQGKGTRQEGLQGPDLHRQAEDGGVPLQQLPTQPEQAGCPETHTLPPAANDTLQQAYQTQQLGSNHTDEIVPGNTGHAHKRKHSDLEPDEQARAGSLGPDQAIPVDGCSKRPSHPAQQQTAIGEANTTAGAAKEPTTATTATAAGATVVDSNTCAPASEPSGQGSDITINFDIGRRDSTIKQSGKKRTQGAQVDGRSVLCVVSDGNGTRMEVTPVAAGKLMEVNQRLKTQPQLLITRPCREGYLAILFPTDHQRAKLESTLCPVDKYLQLRGLSEDDLA